MTGPHPLTDPHNTAGWTLRDDLSAEFTGPVLDTTKWHPTWNTWSPYWRWAEEQVIIEDEILKLRMSYDPSLCVDPAPQDWELVGQRDAVYVAAEQPRSGDAALHFHFRWPYRVTAKRSLDALEPGTYTLRAWTRSSGGQHEASMHIAGFDSSGTCLDRAIRPSNDYVLVEIANIDIANGQAEISISVDSPADEYLTVDDIELVRNGTSNNVVLNGGFEERPITYYKGGIIRSVQTAKYGYFEARIKGPAINPGVGAPGFWLSYQEPTTRTEIGIVEGQQYEDELQTLYHCAHVWWHPKFDQSAAYAAEWDHTWGGNTDVFGWDPGWEPNWDFHVYAVEWDAARITWYVDGKDIGRSRAAHPYFDQPLSVTLSVPLKEPYRSAPTADGFPTDTEIDYVRVWQKA